MIEYQGILTEEVLVSNFVNLVGRTFGKLVVLERVGSKNGSPLWDCLCTACGNHHKATTGVLTKGGTKSCGCAKAELISNKVTSHGLTKHPLYTVLRSMKARCLNSNHMHYHNYGGRGITIYQAWLEDFKVFYDWSMANGWKKGLQIDRIDNDGNYEPDNVKFSTPKENSRNRRTNLIVSYLGESMSLAEAISRSNTKISKHKFAYRIGKYNCTFDEALKHLDYRLRDN